MEHGCNLSETQVLEQRKDIVSRFLPEAGMLHDPNRKDYKGVAISMSRTISNMVR